MVAAFRGESESAESLLREAEAIALPLGASAVLSDIQGARAVIALGGGRYDEAFEHLQRTFDPHDPAHHPFRSSWRIGEYAEAAVHAGRLDQARTKLATTEALAELSRSPRLQIGLLYARPLLANDDDAETHFQAGLSANMTLWPIYRARLLLEYGTWLRRRRRIAEARMPLRAARDALHALGAAPWAARAQQELRASRETRLHNPDAWTELTEQERQIARLAAEGTVGSHLYRIFPKLGIASRTQLPAVIGHDRGDPSTEGSGTTTPLMLFSQITDVP
jgi:ATP/maltotriose-dependent transcriptional regulator MalT